MKNLLNVFSLLIIILLTYSCSDDSNNQIYEEENVVEKVMKSKEELNEGVIQKIFTLSDFEQYSKDKDSVVSKLSNQAKSEFVKSMKFSEDGVITTAKYTMIERELSPEENEAFWLLFGMSKEAYTDYHDFECSAPHNCKRLKDNICLTGC